MYNKQACLRFMDTSKQHANPGFMGKHEISFINTTKEKDLQHNFEGPMRNDSIGNLLTANIISF